MSLLSYWFFLVRLVKGHFSTLASCSQKIQESSDSAAVIGKKRLKVLGEVLLFSSATLFTVSLLVLSLKAGHFIYSQSLSTSPCCWGSSGVVYIRIQPDLRSSYI